jgi:hypothetical protein
MKESNKMYSKCSGHDRLDECIVMSDSVRANALIININKNTYQHCEIQYVYSNCMPVAATEIRSRAKTLYPVTFERSALRRTARHIVTATLSQKH